MGRLKKSAETVQRALAENGLALEVVELPASTRTAREAAAAIGCTVAQIAKSIVFRAASGRAVLVVASGTSRVDEGAVGKVLGEPLEMATPDFVREATGFAIGGVPPCGHPRPLEVLIDRDLMELDVVWAAAGTPNAVFSIEPQQLVRLTKGTVARVTTESGGR